MISERINRTENHFFAWNNIVKRKQDDKRKENEVMLKKNANTSKMSKGTKKMLSELNTTSNNQKVKTGNMQNRNYVRMKLNEYLNQRDNKIIETKNIINQDFLLPNYLNHQESQKIVCKTTRGRKSKIKLLSENIIVRNEKWSKERNKKLTQLRLKESEKTLDECTFSPVFFTRSRPCN